MVERYLKETLGSEPSMESEEVDFSGTWVNELGSQMVLTVSGSGELTGTYTSSIGESDAAEGTLIGFAGQGIIVFCVNFEQYGSVASWSGYYNSETGVLLTLWHLVSPTVQSNLWQSILAGIDGFRKAS